MSVSSIGIQTILPKSGTPQQPPPPPQANDNDADDSAADKQAPPPAPGLGQKIDRTA
jgi:hypothetical protein